MLRSLLRGALFDLVFFAPFFAFLDLALLRLTTTILSPVGSIDSSFIIPSFLTFGFQILSGIQAGAPLGLAT